MNYRSSHSLTSVVVLSVRAILFHGDLATAAEPTGIAPTLPLHRQLIRLALSVTSVTLAGATFEGAVSAVPTVGAETRAVRADPVGGASRVATPLATIAAFPAFVADAGIALARAVRAAVQVAAL